jgi:SAM-dependent methyltransferase
MSLTGPACACGSDRYERMLAIPGANGSAFTIARCKSCGLARTLPPPDPAQYESGYGPTTENAHFAGALADRWSAEVAAEVRRLSRGRSFLDVGCAAGNLVVAASDQGFDAKGIDIDPIATEEGRRHGRALETVSIDQVEGAYDAVVANHVLEHIEDLGVFLSQVERILAPGGRFFVFSPHYGGLIARLRRGRWMGWVPREHFWHFTPQTLGATVERVSTLTTVQTTTRGVIEPPVPGAKGIAVAMLTAASKGLRSGDQVEGVFERRAG